MDVEGDFDAILLNRLLLQLRKQGWPDFLVRWLASFLTHRLASVRFEELADALPASDSGALLPRWRHTTVRIRRRHRYAVTKTLLYLLVYSSY